MNDENIQSNIESGNVQNPAPAGILPILPRRRRANGKIARLPLEARNLVNHALRDGALYDDVVRQLASHGYPGFNRSHVMSWARGGYREWLAQQERFESSRQLSLRTVALLGRLREGGRCELADLNNWVMAAQLTEILDSVDQNSVKQLIAEKPTEYFRLAKVLSAHLAALAHHRAVELDRLKYELEIRKLEAKQAASNKPRGLSPETIRQIEAAAKML